MTVRWQSEIDPYACRVLAKHWPDVPNLGDITQIDWSRVGPVDLICGGYPCPPFSSAGLRLGDADPRHLWPYMLRAIQHLRPRFALLENVPGHLSLGFGRVLGDLAESGYDAEWDCIPAAAVGAPHRRDRVFVIAYPNADSGRCQVVAQRDGQQIEDPPNRYPRRNDSDGLRDHVADPDSARSSRRAGQPDRRPGETRRMEPQRLGHGVLWIGRAPWGHWPPEPDVGRVAHGVPSRVDRLRCLGNAVVPQVAEWIGRRIMEAPA